MILSNEIVCAFHYRSYGAFLCEEFRKRKNPIISFVDLPTTEIIEPKRRVPNGNRLFNYIYS
ncbi:hypothetical protein SuUB23_17190 [Streptococcus uberis]